MASRMGSCIVLVVMAMFIAGSTAQMDCTMAMSSLTPCFAYVTGPEPSPSQVCCDGINNVNSMSPTCLCQLVAQMDANPSVNATKAYALPRDCGLTVDTSQCPASAAPPLPTSMPPLPTSMPPLPTSMPPGLSAPPMPAAPPLDFSIPPGMSFPPGVSAPPLPTSMPPLPAGVPPLPAGVPPLPAGIPPISAPPMFTPPALTPPSGPVVSGPGAAPGPAAAASGAASVSISMAFVAMLAGAVAAFVM